MAGILYNFCARFGHMDTEWSEPFICEDDHKMYQKRHCMGCNRYEYRTVKVTS